MPLYEYECTACHKRTEKIQKFSDPEITDCPKCGGKLERVLSAPAVTFKGGGWYADGYGSKKPAVSGSSEGGSTSGDSAKSDGKPSSDSSTTSSTPSPTPAAAPAATPSTPAKS